MANHAISVRRGWAYGQIYQVPNGTICCTQCTRENLPRDPRYPWTPVAHAVTEPERHAGATAVCPAFATTIEDPKWDEPDFIRATEELWRDDSRWDL
jgi:hypothetical protein